MAGNTSISAIPLSGPSSVPESGKQVRRLRGQEGSSLLVVASGNGKGKEHEAVSSSVVPCMGTEGEGASEQVLSVS